nr:MAG TPA: anaerobic ribonucleoside triphosphate reductase [Caudoviricetes sp.]
MEVRKRNGSLVEFDKSKIENAILLAMKKGSGIVKEKIAEEIANEIEEQYIEEQSVIESEIPIEDIEDLVFSKLIKKKQKLTAKAYESFRSIREFQRKTNTIDKQVEELIGGTSDYWNNENSNKNADLVSTQRDYLAGILSTDISRRYLLTPDIVQAHDEGIIHFHDIDYYGQNALTNCELLDLEDMLQHGTVMNEVLIEKPHRLITATTIATQIITAVTSSTFGGCSITLTHLAPFIRDSYNYYLKKYNERGLTEEQVEKFAKEDLDKEITDSVQTFNYQLNSMSNCNGQSPFLTVFMYLNETEEYKEELALLIEKFLEQRILGMKNEQGAYISMAFPKLIYVLEEDNVRKGSKYYYLTELAAKCTAKRMVPDYISEKIMLREKGDCYPAMGCRSFLTPDRFTDTGKYGNISGSKTYNKDKHKYYGRFNQGVVTISLPDVALSSNKDLETFWNILDERLELCHKALQLRHERLSHVKAKNAPILWQHGALARLDKDDTIHELLHHGYSTISLGYAGLYECVKYMTGLSHIHDEEGFKFGKAVMQRLNDACNKWKAEEDIDYSVYGTPIESTTYKFAKCLKNRFGIIEGITDRDYITNSYHTFVREEIDPFEKLDVEAKYQSLSPGGCISYVECADLSKNLEVVLQIMEHIYDNIMYAELNTKSDYCCKCGYDGEIEIIEKDNGTLGWRCPNCGNNDTDLMNVARRTCGYIGTNFFNQGRTEEIKDRYVHVDNHESN